MTEPFGPERWAIEITKLLNLVLGPEHFPIDVIRVAREYTAQRFPGDAGSVSTCASWRIPVVVGYAAARFRGMKRDAVPGMSINGRQASV